VRGRPDLAVASFNVIPPVNPTAKYDRLGELGMLNRRQWCARQGYRLYETRPLPSERPACWGKFAVLREALRHHEWVLWADSDALVLDQELKADRFCVESADLVSQSMRPVAELLGLEVGEVHARFPITTGVFLVRSTTGVHDLLDRAERKIEYAATPTNGVWNGIGDQEALISALAEPAVAHVTVALVEGLQAHPAHFRPGHDLFVHFYGNLASARVPAAEAEKVIGHWEQTIRSGRTPLATASELATFHWACIQHRGTTTAGLPPERLLYGVDEAGAPVPPAAASAAPKCGVPPI
jgi:galactosyl transferase GMA12/MNN10 family